MSQCAPPAVTGRTGPEMTPLDINDAFREVLILMHTDLTSTTSRSIALYPAVSNRLLAT
jgi:hypothetical protein